MDLSDSIRKAVTELLGSGEPKFATPAYIYSVEQVGENYKDLKAALGTPLVVSLKANHCVELLSRVSFNFDDGCEVASIGEFRLRSGTRLKIYINTPAYTRKLIEVASRHDSTFIVDHPEQLDLIEEVKQKSGFDNGILLRMNLEAATGRRMQPKDHFGMDPETLHATTEKARRLGVKVAGLHVFCGSNGFVEKSAACVEVVSRFHDSISEAAGYPLEILNLGGGIPSDWRDRNIDFASYRASIEPLSRKAQVIHESGRAIFGSVGYFATEVVSVKSIGAKHFVVCDGGMAQNFLLARTEQIIRKHDQPLVVKRRESGGRRDYTFVGPSCNRDDVIGEYKDCPYEILAGDTLVFGNCGAYNALYTVNKFLALKEYSEYII